MADNNPQGRRTIRQRDNALPNPLAPQAGRQNPNIRMWSLGEGPANSTKERLRQVYHEALGAVDQIGAKRAEIVNSGRYTAAGVTQNVTDYALAQMAPRFKRGRNTLEAAKAEAKALREKIKLQPADKTDLVAAMQRRETREFLRAMPEKERRQYISSRRENMDPQFALAITEMPAEFSGVLETDRNDLIDRALQAQHGEAIVQVHELEEAIAIAESAVEVGRDEVRQETGLPLAEFDARAQPFEQKVGPAWLRKYTFGGEEKVGVVDLGTRAIRPATEEEAQTGKYYQSFDEYQKDNPTYDGSQNKWHTR
jgi:hypothetical protein